MDDYQQRNIPPFRKRRYSSLQGSKIRKAQGAVASLTDISARKYVNTLLGSEYLSFGMPWEIFLEMEGNVERSFLEKHTWLSLQESKQ